MVNFALGIVGVIIVAITGKRIIRLACKVINAFFDVIEKHLTE